MKNSFEVDDIIYVVNHAEEFAEEFRNEVFKITKIEINNRKIWFHWNGADRFFTDSQFSEVINFKKQKPNRKFLRLLE